MKRLRLFLSIMFLNLMLSFNAHAYSILDDFDRILGESLTVPFINPSYSTVNSYGDWVEIIVSGRGQSFGLEYNDAFYGVPSGIEYSSAYYRLNIGWSGFELFPHVGEPNNIDNYMGCIEGIGVVPIRTLPAYNTDYDHRYHFAIKIPNNVGKLAFGVSDGDFSDNTGAYQIQLFQLQPKGPLPPVIPEPTTLLLLGTGLIGFGVKFRKGFKK